MYKPICVFSHDSNPDSDPPKYWITRTDAANRIAKGYARFLSEYQVQLQPPVGWEPNRTESMISGLFDEAWMPCWSGGFIVWQMRSEAAGNV
jgi:hypothetical protein